MDSSPDFIIKSFVLKGRQETIISYKVLLFFSRLNA